VEHIDQRDLAVILNAMKDAINDESNPHKVPNSLTRTYTDTKDDTLHKRYNAILAYPRIKSNVKKLIPDITTALLEYTVTVDIILSTPAALAQYINIAPEQQPSVIFMDEVGRLIETATRLILSECPNAPILMVRDTKQYKPIIQANQNGTKVFRLQYGISLLEHIIQVEHITI
jgi:hypothetical protein